MTDIMELLVPTFVKRCCLKPQCCVAEARGDQTFFQMGKTLIKAMRYPVHRDITEAGMAASGC